MAFSSPTDVFLSAHLLLRPWFRTQSSEPHNNVRYLAGSFPGYAPAGLIEYEVQGAEMEEDADGNDLCVSASLCV